MRIRATILTIILIDQAIQMNQEIKAILEVRHIDLDLSNEFDLSSALDRRHSHALDRALTLARARAHALDIIGNSSYTINQRNRAL